MEQALISVPYAYTVEHRRPGARKFVERSVLDDIPVPVRILSDAEFPVAAIVKDDTADLKGWPAFEVRWDGERTYRPVTYETVDSREHLEASIIEDSEERRSPFREEARLHRYGDTPVELRTLPGDIRPKDRRDRQNAIARIADSLVIHDGMLWEACGEPCYRYQSGQWSKNAWLDVCFVDSARSCANPHQFYRATRLHQCIGRAALQGETLRDGFGIEVLMPEVFRLDFEEPGLIEMTVDALRMAEHSLSGASKDAFAVYADLRDMKPSERDTIDLELEGAIQDFVAHPFWRQLSGYRLAPALNRWLTRDEPAPDAENAQTLIHGR